MIIIYCANIIYYFLISALYIDTLVAKIVNITYAMYYSSRCAIWCIHQLIIAKLLGNWLCDNSLQLLELWPKLYRDQIPKENFWAMVKKQQHSRKHLLYMKDVVYIKQTWIERVTSEYYRCFLTLCPAGCSRF